MADACFFQLSLGNNHRLAILNEGRLDYERMIANYKVTCGIIVFIFATCQIDYNNAIRMQSRIRDNYPEMFNIASKYIVVTFERASRLNRHPSNSRSAA